MSECYLCKYCSSEECRKINEYVTDNAGRVGVYQMAEAIHQTLQDMDVEAEQGTDMATIIEHLGTHTLNPQLRLSKIMRGMLAVLDDISTTLTTTDDDGKLVIDGKNLKYYLETAREVRQLYQTGTASKLFNESKRIKYKLIKFGFY